MFRRANLSQSLVLVAALLIGCPDPEAEIRSSVQLVSGESGEVAERAIKKLIPHGRKALPHIESALHSASQNGRRNLVMALRRIGDGEAAFLLGHLAAHDEDSGVRLEARWTLRLWVAQGGERGKNAAAALRNADEVRGNEGAG